MHIDFNLVSIVQLKPADSLDQDFECKNKEYTEYYRVHAFNDMKNGLSKTWLCIYKNKVIGYITIAMAHMRPERHGGLQGKGYGNIPALLIGQLATHKEHEKKGIGRELIHWAIREATRSSQRMGCRIVMLNPADDEKIRTYYRNRGFTYVPHNDKENDAFYLDIQRVKKPVK